MWLSDKILIFQLVISHICFTLVQNKANLYMSVMWFLLGSDHRRGNVHLCIRFIFNCSVKLCSLIHNESRRLFSRCLTASEIPALCLITTRYTHTHTAQRTGPATHTHSQQCAWFLPHSSPWSLENSSFNKLLIIFSDQSEISCLSVSLDSKIAHS